MSGAPGHPALRARIAAALEAEVAASGTRATGELIGHSSSTVSRRGDDLALWPAADLLALAVSRPALAQTICTYLMGEEVDEPAAAARVVSEVHQAMASAGDLVAIASRSLSDGKVDRAEAREIREGIASLGGRLQVLMHDLDAIDPMGGA